MSPAMCSQSGFSFLLTSSMFGERSTKVISKSAFMWDALFPPPEPSSRTVRGGSSEASLRVRVKNPASSSYSSGRDNRGHQSAISEYINGSAMVKT